MSYVGIGQFITCILKNPNFLQNISDYLEHTKNHAANDAPLSLPIQLGVPLGKTAGYLPHTLFILSWQASIDV